MIEENSKTPEPQKKTSSSPSTAALLLDLFVTFARIGLFTFGGGYAMLPMLRTELVEKKKWVNEKGLLNYYAIAQCTPGIISVNTATFVGYELRGLLGGIIATLGVVTPSCVIILLIAFFLEDLSSMAIVQHAFAGVRIAVAALMAQAIVQLWKTGIRDIVGIFIFVFGFCIAAFTKLSPVWVILASIALGLLANHLGIVRNLEKEKKGDAP